MECSTRGCPGEYEEGVVVHAARYKGQIVVIEDVPAEICSVCGDVLLRPETVRHIEKLLKAEEAPRRTAPLYQYV